MRTWKLTVNENELKALIAYHAGDHLDTIHRDGTPSADTSARIHDLTKRLNKDNGEVDISNDPRPEAKEEVKQEQTTKDGWS